MPTPDCPTPAELSAFSLGVLPEARLDVVAEHLERCARCESAVRSLDGADDPMIASLRGLSAAGEPAAAPASAPAAIPARIGDYEVLGELGRGAMGVVYKAWHARLRRVVALKVLQGGEYAREGYRARFRAEAEAVARLQHPNIVQIFDTGEWRAGDAGPLAYFTLEYVAGGSLSTRLEGKPRRPAWSAGLLLTLARAVDHAHGQGIVHRDLKPSNVLLTADGRPKLCDFGVAKVLTGSALETLGGLLVGTPEYMAPEQAAGQARHVGAAADVYALGAILYEMLTGRPPFQAASVLETLERVRTQEPVSPRRLQPSLPRDLETICLKCLNKDPRRRYAGAGALADDLERFLEHRPILARPAGPLRRAWKRARRRPTEATLSSAVALLVVLGFSLVLWQWRRAESKAADEADALARARQAQRLAVRGEAELALDRGLALCDRGEVAHGLLWLARGLQLANTSQAEGLRRAARIDLADWLGQLSRPRAAWWDPAPVADLAFGPDGRSLVSVGRDRSVRARAMVHEGGEPGGPRPGLLPGGLRAGRIAFSPAGGGRLAAAGDRGRVILWDASRRKPLAPSLEHPPGVEVTDLAFGPDGRTLVTAGDDGKARLWDAETGRPLGEALRHGTTPGAVLLAIRPDERTLATGGADGRVVLWELATGRRLDPPLPHDAPVTALAYARDGRRIIAGTADGRIALWDPEGRRAFELPSQGSAVNGLAVSPDGRTFATAAEGGLVRRWDAETRRQTGQTLLVRSVTRLAFSPGGGLLATGQDDGSVRLWALPRPKAIGAPVRLASPVRHLAFGREGTRLLAVGASEACSWALLGGRVSGEGRAGVRIGSGDSPTVADPDGLLLATARTRFDGGRARGWVEVRDAPSGRLLRRTPERPGAIVGLAFGPDADRLLTWGVGAGDALLWDAATLHEPRPVLRSLDVGVRQAVFGRDGMTLLLACPDGTARLWDLINDQEINPGLRPHYAYPVTAVALDPRRARLATGCQDGTVGLWDAAAGKSVFDARGEAGAVAAVAFSPDGQTLLSAGHDGTARFLDAATGTPLGPPLRHADAVLCAAFHPDGKSVATGTRDGRVQLWDVPPPPAADPIDRLRRRVETETGLWLDYQGVARPLAPDPGSRPAAESRTPAG